MCRLTNPPPPMCPLPQQKDGEGAKIIPGDNGYTENNSYKVARNMRSV